MSSAGDSELIEGIDEADRCLRQMRSDQEAVRQEPQQLQAALQRFSIISARLAKAACTDA